MTDQWELLKWQSSILISSLSSIESIDSDKDVPSVTWWNLNVLNTSTAQAAHRRFFWNEWDEEALGTRLWKTLFLATISEYERANGIEVTYVAEAS